MQISEQALPALQLISTGEGKNHKIRRESTYCAGGFTAEKYHIKNVEKQS